MPATESLEEPIYSPTEAARLAGTTTQTIARWRRGYSFPVAGGKGRSRPITGGTDRGLLSFNDLLEIAVVAAARSQPANVPMQAIRRAVEAAKEIYGLERPLLSLKFQHHGRELFIREIDAGESAGPYVNLSRRGQVAWEHVADVLKDLEYADGRAVRWFPRGRAEPIVIDPRISFGRPYVVTKGISTDAVRTRFQAHESLPAIAEDLGLTEAEAEAALRFELPLAA